MRTLLCCLLLLGGLGLSRTEAAEVHAVLVEASPNPGGVDAGLAAVQRQLEATFRGRFKGYKLLGQGRVQLEAGKGGTINLGQGMTVDIQFKGMADGKFSINANWKHGKVSYANAGIKVRNNQPWIVGGPARGANSLILILKAK